MKKISRRNFLKAMGITAGVAALAGCGGGDSTSNANTDGGKKDTPLVVGYLPFNGKFSPFFAETEYDRNVSDMTQIGLLTNDRNGAIIYNGIQGETIPYNGKDYNYTGAADIKVTENDDGTVFYDITMRDDLKFSDGEPVTIDDAIFSMYVSCDPTFDGGATLYALPIDGLREYRSGMQTRLDLILATENKGYEANDYYTEEQYNAFWQAFNAAGEKFAQEIVDYVIAQMSTTGVADSAAAWGFEGLKEDATAADFFAAIVAKYGYDISDAGINAESAGSSLSALIMTELGDKADEIQTGVQTGEGADYIKGIQKTGDYRMRVVLTSADATAIYQLGVQVCPLHYYGDKSLYDYDAHKFGFPKGDLSKVREATSNPMGAGPYKFVKYENGVVNFEANELYYKGAPKTKFVNFLESQETDKLNGIITGTIDISDPSFEKDTVDAVEQANGGELSGKVITVSTVDNLGYGYIGMSANVLNVGGEPGSDASKNLRKAFGTVLAVYRDVAIDTYYGERATVINYPISNTSWAAPQSTDDGYKLAFSTDVDGNDIYTSSMSAEEKYDAALKAALGFFEAAGYTVENGMLTAAPKGAALEYELLIPADGAGDHPSFMVCTNASDAMKKIGMNLIVRDLSNGTELWDGIEAETVAMWAAAWAATIDPDMYQIYYADVEHNGENAGGSNYMYDIADPDLDQMILDARTSTDQTYRKAVYKACLDTIIDWAVEVPVYQRQNAITISTERVDVNTITPDITPFWPWTSEIEKIELNANK